VATPTALAVCAGAVDLLAFAGLGGAFASVVTGNLVVVGLGLAKLDASVLAPAAVAVGGYAVGAAIWQWIWRRRLAAIVGPLIAESVLVLVLALGWWLAHTRPSGEVSLILLSVASLAMGGQSIAALRLKASTTYMTGTLTGAVHDLVARESAAKVAAALRQLAALASGATVAGALLVHQRWAVPLLPLCSLAVAAGGHLLMANARPPNSR
jgi:uncharacterized membrane protein YoaK (UPF0700 family)